MAELRSIDDIATLAGVSKSTVSRALNDSPLISAATRERIKAIAATSGFRLSAAARSLSRKSSATIGFVSNAFRCSPDRSIADPFSLEILGSITRNLHNIGHDLLIIHLGPESGDWIADYHRSGKVDGFIIMHSPWNHEPVRQAAAASLPFITWGADTGPWPSVCSDDIQGGRLAAAHLIAGGRRSIAFVGGPAKVLEVQQRHAGWQQILSGADLYQGELEYFANWGPAGGQAACAALLDAHPEIDAIFACSDQQAVGVLAELHRRGIRVPDDLALVGYDDLHIASCTWPTLSTIRQNIQQGGEILVQNLRRYLDDGIITRTLLPVSLVQRGSS